MKSVRINTVQAIPLPILNLPEEISCNYVVCSWIDENYYYYGRYNTLPEAYEACENNPNVIRYLFKVINET